MLFKNNDLLFSYLMMITLYTVVSNFIGIPFVFDFYIVYIPLFILFKFEDWGYTSCNVYLNQIEPEVKNEIPKFNIITEDNNNNNNNTTRDRDCYKYGNYKADYKLYGYPNVVREYVVGNNLYEVQAKYKADPKVSKLLRVIEIK